MKQSKRNPRVMVMQARVRLEALLQHTPTRQQVRAGAIPHVFSSPPQGLASCWEQRKNVFINTCLWCWLKNRGARVMTKRGIWEARRNTRKSTEMSQKESCRLPILCQELFHKPYNSFQWRALTEVIIISILRDEKLTDSERVTALPMVTQTLRSRAGIGTHDFLTLRPQFLTLHYAAWSKSCNVSELSFSLLHTRDWLYFPWELQSYCERERGWMRSALCTVKQCAHIRRYWHIQHAPLGLHCGGSWPSLAFWLPWEEGETGLGWACCN